MFFSEGAIKPKSIQFQKRLAKCLFSCTFVKELLKILFVLRISGLAHLEF